jgi:hypothetical protein
MDLLERGWLLNDLCLLAPFLLLSALDLGRFVRVLGRLDEDLLLSTVFLGGFAEDLLQSAEVLFPSPPRGGEEEKDLFLIAQVPRRLEKVAGGPENVVGRLDQDLVRLDEDLLLSAELLGRCEACGRRLVQVLGESARDLFPSAKVGVPAANDLLLSPKAVFMSANDLLLPPRENRPSSLPLCPFNCASRNSP